MKDPPAKTEPHFRAESSSHLRRAANFFWGGWRVKLTRSFFVGFAQISAVGGRDKHLSVSPVVWPSSPFPRCPPLREERAHKFVLPLYSSRNSGSGSHLWRGRRRWALLFRLYRGRRRRRRFTATGGWEPRRRRRQKVRRRRLPLSSSCE